MILGGAARVYSKLLVEENRKLLKARMSPEALIGFARLVGEPGAQARTARGGQRELEATSAGSARV